jgi:aldose 1-epimerase
MKLRQGSLALEIAPHGAAVVSLEVDGIETLLQPKGAGQDATDGQYLNQLAGRVANRIAHGRFLLDGEVVQVSVNEGGVATLHGGEIGWSMRDWTLERTPAGVRAAYVSPDGEMGFPGEVRAAADFGFVAEDAFEIRYLATVDRPTPVNLAHHLYFNLSGRSGTSVLDHRLTVAADAIVPCGPGLIPTGALMDVEGSPFDFRKGRRIADALAEPHPQLALAGGIDHTFVLGAGVLRAGATPALRLESAESGVVLELDTDQPGVQLYAGQKLGPPWIVHEALAVEPQDFPDAVNHPAFPPTIVRPGDTYRRRSVYRLTRG